MNLNLAGKVALITGASRGIGRAVAHSLAAEGVHVAFCARNEEILEQAAAELSAVSPGKVLAVTADIESAEDIRRFVAKTVEDFGRIDLLVNNAGPGAVAGHFLNLDDAAWERAVRVRILGYVRTVKEVIPVMIRQGKGRIINMAGIGGKEPDDWTIMMGTVTAGIVNFTRGLSRAFSSQGVTAVGVAPGRTFTSNTPNVLRRVALERNVSEEEVKRSILGHIPLGRFIQPEEIGSVVAFLSSDLAAGINGSTVMVDGGEMRGL